MLATAFGAEGMVIAESIQPKRPRRLKSLGYIAVVFLMCLTVGGSDQQGPGPYSTPLATRPPRRPQRPGRVAAASYYVDCSEASNGTGTQSSPWNTLASVSATTFTPGDRILFRCGTTCRGTLEPLGSGATRSPIVIDAYGTGPQPIIDGEMNTAAVQLIGQQGWEINNLEVVGGNYYGVNIAATAPNTAYTHFRLTNLSIHGAHHTATGNDSGEIFITIGNNRETINDIVIDGVTVHDSQFLTASLSMRECSRLDIACAAGEQHHGTKLVGVQHLRNRHHALCRRQRRDAEQRGLQHRPMPR